MKNKYLAISLCLTMIVSLSACQNNDLPKNPVITFPITSLVLEVSGDDFTAVPILDDTYKFTDELSLLVKIPSEKAIVKEISVQKGYTTNITKGDEVHFTDNILNVNLQNGSETKSCVIRMEFNPPPILYAVKTSDRDEEGSSYYLDVETQDFLASGNYDNYYEGELDLTQTNWDNVGLVSQDLTTIYSLSAGPWPAQSHYIWIAEAKASTGGTHYRMDGPWNDWLVTNNNEDIISPGVWRVIFDFSTLTCDMTMTQWAINGSAVSQRTAMLYDSKSHSWNLTSSLNSGDIYFETIPVSFGDPAFYLGYKENIFGMLASDGSYIHIAEPGLYDLILTLSNPPYYTYSIIKK